MATRVQANLDQQVALGAQIQSLLLARVMLPRPRRKEPRSTRVSNGQSTLPAWWNHRLNKLSRTRDGTTIITSSYDQQVCSFLVPEDLLEPREQPLILRPHRTLRLPEPTNVVAPAPYYDIRFPNTDHFLVACRDHPLQLYQALPPGKGLPEEDASQAEHGSSWKAPISSYRLISPTTEAYHQIHALVWPFPGTHFYVGTRDLIADFDITRNGQGPSTLIPTIPSRRHIRKGNGIGMRGTVSALSAQTTADDIPSGLIAAGTWTRWVGLYDVHRSGECTATWSIKETAEGVLLTDPSPNLALPQPEADGTSHRGMSTPVRGIGGAGITQTTWSPCGRYLVLNERQSTGMLVYDVRVTNKMLGFLAGRDALTHQRLSCDVFRGPDSVGGFEVWAGTKDGTVKVWERVGNSEGCQWPSWDFSAVDGRPGGQGSSAPALGSVGLHHSGSVVATCSGCWSMSDDDGDESSRDGPVLPTLGRPFLRKKLEDSSLALWRVGAAAVSNEAGDISESMQVDMPIRDPTEFDEPRFSSASALETTQHSQGVSTRRMSH